MSVSLPASGGKLTRGGARINYDVGSYSQLCLEAEKPPGESSKLVSKIHTPMLQSVWRVISVEDLEGGAVRMEGISSL